MPRLFGKLDGVVDFSDWAGTVGDPFDLILAAEPAGGDSPWLNLTAVDSGTFTNLSAAASGSFTNLTDSPATDWENVT